MFSWQAFASPTSKTKAVNNKVRAIDESLKKDAYAYIDVALQGADTEGSPATLKFYIEKSSWSLVLLKVQVGFETWSNTHRYYFESGKILKIKKTTRGRPDNPPDEAIIYGKSGKVIWRNMEKPYLDESSVLDLFKSIVSAQRAFNKY